MSGILLVSSFGILFKIVNELILGDGLFVENKQTLILLLACIVGIYFSYRAGRRCGVQMEGESRRWKERLKAG